MGIVFYEAVVNEGLQINRAVTNEEKTFWKPFLLKIIVEAKKLAKGSMQKERRIKKEQCHRSLERKIKSQRNSYFYLFSTLVLHILLCFPHLFFKYTLVSIFQNPIVGQEYVILIPGARSLICYNIQLYLLYTQGKPECQSNTNQGGEFLIFFLNFGI